MPHPKKCKWLADGGKTEVCYWRKFWGFRNEVVDIFDCNAEDLRLNPPKIDIIIETLEKFLERDYYDNYGDSIWEYDEYLLHNIECLQNLKCVKQYLINHPDVECYFYDSY
mgnify:CR=1 FL=1